MRNFETYSFEFWVDLAQGKNVFFRVIGHDGGTGTDLMICGIQEG